MDRQGLVTVSDARIARAFEAKRTEQHLAKEAARTLVEHGILLIGGGVVDHDTILYDVHDCKVYPMTADSGASPTYGTGIDVPGIAQVGINPNIIANELKGDAQVIDRRARIDSFPFTATYGKLDLDVLSVIIETAAGVVDVGATPNQRAYVDIEGGNEPPYFGIAVQFEDTDIDVGMLRAMVWKAKITGGTLLTGQTDQYGQPTLEASGIPTESHNKMVRFEIFESEALLPTANFPA